LILAFSIFHEAKIGILVGIPTNILILLYSFVIML
jgi:hypothetical protein